MTFHKGLPPLHFRSVSGNYGNKWEIASGYSGCPSRVEHSLMMLFKSIVRRAAARMRGRRVLTRCRAPLLSWIRHDGARMTVAIAIIAMTIAVAFAEDGASRE